MSDVVKVLEAARERISSEENWAQGDFAYAIPEEEGGDLIGVEAGHPDACKWCASGAIQLVDDDEYSPALKALCAAIGGAEWMDPTDTIEKIAKWNDADERTHAEVLAAFDRAIEKAENHDGPEEVALDG